MFTRDCDRICAAPATLFGHSITYALGTVSLADGRHTYFLPALQALVTLTLGLALALIVRSLVSAPVRPGKICPVAPSLSKGGLSMPMLGRAQHDTVGITLSLWAIFSFTQCAFFVSLEFLEGYRAGPLGCAIQVVVALMAALLVVWFNDLLERCEEISLARGIYLPRPTNNQVLITDRSLCPIPVNGLNERRGIRRFQRPPPGL